MKSQVAAVHHHRRASQSVVREVVALATLLTKRWFTSDVPAALQKDLLFQDLLCVTCNGRIRSFLSYTSLDGAMHITLMGTHPDFHGQGLGSLLIGHLVREATRLRFERIVAFTVPPDKKPAFAGTLRFYETNGFVLVKRHSELWQSGALELVRTLPAGSPGKHLPKPR
jgi:GNAT superfamily N-acetyltransferase